MKKLIDFLVFSILTWAFSISFMLILSQVCSQHRSRSLGSLKKKGRCFPKATKDLNKTCSNSTRGISSREEIGSIVVIVLQLTQVRTPHMVVFMTAICPSSVMSSQRSLAIWLYILLKMRQQYTCGALAQPF